MLRHPATVGLSGERLTGLCGGSAQAVEDLVVAPPRGLGVVGDEKATHVVLKQGPYSSRW
ncbi:hypothetical protein BH18ACT8_BH18ACT8_10580 [soil metagenome]